MRQPENFKELTRHQSGRDAYDLISAYQAMSEMARNSLNPVKSLAEEYEVDDEKVVEVFLKDAPSPPEEVEAVFPGPHRDMDGPYDSYAEFTERPSGRVEAKFFHFDKENETVYRHWDVLPKWFEAYSDFEDFGDMRENHAVADFQILDQRTPYLMDPKIGKFEQVSSLQEVALTFLDAENIERSDRIGTINDLLIEANSEEECFEPEEISDKTTFAAIQIFEQLLDDYNPQMGGNWENTGRVERATDLFKLDNFVFQNLGRMLDGRFVDRG